METLIDAVPHLANYQMAFVWAALLGVAVLIQGFIAGVIGLGQSDEEPGLPLKGGHKDFSFRTLRTYANSAENLPMFTLTLFLAVIASVSPTWVNWLVGIHVVLRLLYWAVYYSGIGKVGGGIRTVIYASGLFANLVLALVVLTSLV